MTLVIIVWGMQPVKEALNSIGQIKFHIPGLNGAILKPDGSGVLDVKPFDFNILSTAGTAVILSAFLAMPLIGIGFKKGISTLLETLNQVKFPIITIASIVGFAFVENYSGMSISMAMALASTAVLFPFFSPILGWLGVFLTGSITASNALFCKIQHSTAQSLGIDPLLMVGANVSGGATGKMISPQSLAVGAAAVGLVGRESELIRFTLKHSIIMLMIISAITILQAYVFVWFIPDYQVVEASSLHTDSGVFTGFLYLLYLLVMLILIALSVFLLNRKKTQ
jgi:lactate permease